MATLLRRGLGLIAPNGPVALDENHPLGRGLFGFVAADHAGTRFPPVAAGGAVRTTGPGGAGWRVAGSSTSKATYTNAALGLRTGSNAAAPFTIQARLTTTAFTSLASPVLLGTESTGAMRGLLTYPDASTLYFWGATRDASWATFDLTTRPVVDLVVTFDGTYLHPYVNGALIGAAKLPNDGSSPNTFVVLTSADVVVGGKHSAATGGITGTVYKALFYDRCLTPDEVQWAWQEPYAMLIQTRSTRWYTPDAVTISGAGASTLDGFTASAAGAETDPGASAPTLAGFTCAVSGAQTNPGACGPTLDGFTASASGAETITGTLAVTLDSFTCVGGTIARGGTATATATQLHTATALASQLHTATVTAIQLHTATATVTEDFT